MAGMTRRDEEDASGEGTSWLVFRHAAAEGVGLIGNALRERGIHHRALDLARGEPVPKDLRGVGGLIVLGGWPAELTGLPTESVDAWAGGVARVERALEQRNVPTVVVAVPTSYVAERLCRGLDAPRRAVTAHDVLGPRALIDALVIDGFEFVSQTTTQPDVENNRLRNWPPDLV